MKNGVRWLFFLCAALAFSTGLHFARTAGDSVNVGRTFIFGFLALVRGESLLRSAWETLRDVLFFSGWMLAAALTRVLRWGLWPLLAGIAFRCGTAYAFLRDRLKIGQGRFLALTGLCALLLFSVWSCAEAWRRRDYHKSHRAFDQTDRDALVRYLLSAGLLAVVLFLLWTLAAVTDCGLFGLLKNVV